MPSLPFMEIHQMLNAELRKADGLAQMSVT